MDEQQNQKKMAKRYMVVRKLNKEPIATKDLLRKSGTELKSI